jgi:hypothetical protein
VAGKGTTEASELAGPHNDEPGPVDVASIETDRLTDPHAGHREQPDHGP